MSKKLSLRIGWLYPVFRDLHFYHGLLARFNGGMDGGTCTVYGMLGEETAERIRGWILKRIHPLRWGGESQ